VPVRALFGYPSDSVRVLNLASAVTISEPPRFAGGSNS